MRFALLLLVACASSPRPKPTPPDASAEIDQAARLGTLLYLHDQAAWKATDALSPAQRADPRLRGWVVTRVDETNWLVTFVRAEGDSFAPLFRVERDGDEIEARDATPDDVLSAADLAQVRARDRAIRTPITRCAETYNFVILPASLIGKPGWLVYIMPAATRPGEIISGVFYQVHVGDDGEIVESKPFTKACIGGISPSGKTTAVFVTQLLGDTPTEIHVFNSLTHSIPIVVVTKRGYWTVSGARIERYVPVP